MGVWFHKVVSKTKQDGIFGSAILSAVNGVQVFYEMGKTAVPPEGWGPLASFSSLSEAEQFSRNYKVNGVILKGTGTLSAHDQLWFQFQRKTEAPDVSETITVKRYGLTGTVFLDSFTPAEEIKPSAQQEAA